MKNETDLSNINPAFKRKNNYSHLSFYFNKTYNLKID